MKDTTDAQDLVSDLNDILAGKIHGLKHDRVIAKAAATIARLQGEIVGLREALKPFAEFGRVVDETDDGFGTMPDDETVSVSINTRWGTFLKFEAYRRARAALTHSADGVVK